MKLADIRNNGRDIYSTNFADYLPQTLKRDVKMKALAAAVTKQMLGVSGQIDNVLIYSRINELPEELIDILAYDMHVDWYDYSYPVEVKRRVLRNSVRVHKKMGTKYAVEMALGDVHKEADVYEWFEYGGKPYHFRIRVNISNEGLSEYTGNEITEKVNFYKNLRSHCDGIYYHLGMDPAGVTAAAYSCLGGILKVKAKLTDSVAAADRLPVLSAHRIGGMLKVKTGLTENLSGHSAGRITAPAAHMIAGNVRIKTAVTESVRADGAKMARAGVMCLENMRVKTKTAGELGSGMKVAGQVHARIADRIYVKH